MEYFLPLAVMTMIISYLSMFLVDYQQPATSIDPKNNTPSNPPDLIGNSVDDTLLTEKNEDDIDGKPLSEENAEENPLINSTKLKAFSEALNYWWNATPKQA